MKNTIKFFCKRDADDSSCCCSSFSRLPDEIILQILSKFDFKTLCGCYLVSKRFSSIVIQFNTISLTLPRPLIQSSISDQNTFRDIDGGGCPIELFRQFIDGSFFKPLSLLHYMNLVPRNPCSCSSTNFSFSGDSFRSSVRFLSKFRGIKSLCIQLPCCSSQNNNCLFKWKVNFGTRIQSFIFLSPNSISDGNGYYVNGHGYGEGDEEGEENMELNSWMEIHTAFRCLQEAILRHRMLMYIVKDIPSLEEVAITDSERRGKVSLSGEKLNEVKEFVNLDAVTVRSHMYRIEVPDRVSQCYVPVLELPVSGYVMKGVSVVVMEMNGVQGGNDSFLNTEDCCEGKEEAAYTEAVMEIWEKHKGMMQRLHALEYVSGVYS